MKNQVKTFSFNFKNLQEKREYYKMMKAIGTAHKLWNRNSTFSEQVSLNQVVKFAIEKAYKQIIKE